MIPRFAGTVRQALDRSPPLELADTREGLVGGCPLAPTVRVAGRRALRCLDPGPSQKGLTWEGDPPFCEIGSVEPTMCHTGREWDGEFTDGFLDRWHRTDQVRQESVAVGSTCVSPRRPSDGQVGRTARTKHSAFRGRQHEVGSTAPCSPRLPASPRRPRTEYPRGRHLETRTRSRSTDREDAAEALDVRPLCGVPCGPPGSTSQERSLQRGVREQAVGSRCARHLDTRPWRSVRVAMTESGRYRTHPDEEEGL